MLSGFRTEHELMQTAFDSVCQTNHNQILYDYVGSYMNMLFGVSKKSIQILCLQYQPKNSNFEKIFAGTSMLALSMLPIARLCPKLRVTVCTFFVGEILSLPRDLITEMS